MTETIAGTVHRLAGSPSMRLFVCLPLLLLAACDDRDQDQSRMSADIIDRPASREGEGPLAGNNVGAGAGTGLANNTTPAEPTSEARLPSVVQGQWAGINDSCGDRTAELELTVTPTTLVFHESVGTVRSVSAGKDGRIRVDASFTGEGQSWTRVLELRPSANGREMTMVNDGTAVVRKRC